MNRVLLEGLMKIKGLTTAKLAAEMGISQAALYKRLQGTQDFSVSEVKQIQKILGLSNSDVIQIFLEDL